MIDSLQLNDNLITIKVSGTVDRDDWQQVTDMVNEALEHHERVSVLADLTHLDSFTAGAVYEDTKLGIKNLGSLDHFDKIAVLTEQQWLERGAQVAEKLLPNVDVRVFDTAETQQAHRWVTNAS
ncbi:SpoIIAA family protein [Yaniella halotolerans]|uniref:STAS/SEC14 domain-containing protein n=1 Tax=Yaniella halotolerans TaxID=225453 RepID=UPI0003B5F28F|nr:STAS/SEC14 domain-containing protein [Yaniella halotolerans]